MKKLILLILTLSIGFSLTACKFFEGPEPKPMATDCAVGFHNENDVCVEDVITCSDGYVLVNDECVEPEPQVGDVDFNAVYATYFSGTENMNPHSENSEASVSMYKFLTDSLYRKDYDWARAIEEGLATEEGDFETSGAASLPYGRFPAMAAGEPVDVNGDGKVWEITLRDDLMFEDGRIINALAFEYSWKQLLSSWLSYTNSSYLYDEDKLPLIYAKEYFVADFFARDDLGFQMFKKSGIILAREFSYYGTVIDHPDWELYYVQLDSPWNSTHLVGPNGEEPYLEDWGTGYESDNSAGTRFFLEDEKGNTFHVDEEGNLYAPEAGWLLDGLELPIATGDEILYAGGLPAYMDENGNYAALYSTSGLPLNSDLMYEYVYWRDVGFKVTGQFSFQITLSIPKTSWEVKGALLSPVTGVVHPKNYEAGISDDNKKTSYGTIDNPLVSYGRYTLKEWSEGETFNFERNEDHYASDEMRIKYFRYNVIEDQSVAFDEFKAGHLDALAASGDYFEQFKNNLNLKLYPTTTFFRYAFNIGGSDNYDVNPLLEDVNFRKAIYHAIDREDYSKNVRAPSHPTIGFLGPVYLSSQYSKISYRESATGIAVLEDLYPETYGYNPTEAKRLFDIAYQNLVDNGTILAGEVVSLEFTYYDVERGWDPYRVLKTTFETIFNEGEASPIFEFRLKPVSSSALSQAWKDGDFEMTFGGWQGLESDAASMLGQVYNSSNTYMLEKGFDTANTMIEVTLPNTKLALEAWALEYESKTTTTKAEDDAYDEWVDMITEFGDDDVIECTFDELYTFAYGALEKWYQGKDTDFDLITAALEKVLLDQMIAIPLFTTVSATVYSSRVVFEANEYHAVMAWGGLKYMYIQVEAN